MIEEIAKEVLNEPRLTLIQKHRYLIREILSLIVISCLVWYIIQDKEREIRDKDKQIERVQKSLEIMLQGDQKIKEMNELRSQLKNEMPVNSTLKTHVDEN